MSADPETNRTSPDTTVPAPDAAAVTATVRMTLQSDPVAVRDSLRRLFSMEPLCDLSVDARGTTEIVLAEVLNNIVEHAYAAGPGEIGLTLRYGAPDLWCEIADAGLPMPNATLPDGQGPVLGPGDALPEGGFGWFLIRTLTEDLAYQRTDGRNLLCFRLRLPR